VQVGGRVAWGNAVLMAVLECSSLFLWVKTWNPMSFLYR
jgi:hypothetical protein